GAGRARKRGLVGLVQKWIAQDRLIIVRVMNDRAAPVAAKPKARAGCQSDRVHFHGDIASVVEIRSDTIESGSIGQVERRAAELGTRLQLNLINDRQGDDGAVTSIRNALYVPRPI